jgi:hypothetical protein
MSAPPPRPPHSLVSSRPKYPRPRTLPSRSVCLTGVGHCYPALHLDRCEIWTLAPLPPSPGVTSTPGPGQPALRPEDRPPPHSPLSRFPAVSPLFAPHTNAD